MVQFTTGVREEAIAQRPSMHIVIFGLTVSSSWGNGHATIWRALCGALARQGHRVVFFEKDVPYYAKHRDLPHPELYDLVLYGDWNEVEQQARELLSSADAAMVTSYCPDALAASDLVLASRALRVFYDLDSPVTLERLKNGEAVDYIPPYGLGPFDLVLSYAGGSALEDLQKVLGARRVAPLYGSADPELHKPVSPSPDYCADLSYLGTYAADRQPALEELFIEPARRSPKKRFVIGGAMYPEDFPWNGNIAVFRHVPPPQHPAFYSSSKLTLNVMRAAMANTGYCPSGRLFEAAACETPVVSDAWEGLDSFFQPGREILTASSSSDVVDILNLDDEELRQIAVAARERVMEEHTAEHRSKELIRLLEVCA